MVDCSHSLMETGLMMAFTSNGPVNLPNLHDVLARYYWEPHILSYMVCQRWAHRQSAIGQLQEVVCDRAALVSLLILWACRKWSCGDGISRDYIHSLHQDNKPPWTCAPTVAPSSVAVGAWIASLESIQQEFAFFLQPPESLAQSSTSIPPRSHDQGECSRVRDFDQGQGIGLHVS